MIRRPPRSTQSRSSAASDVYKRQVITPTQARTSLGRSFSVESMPTSRRSVVRPQVRASRIVVRSRSRSAPVSYTHLRAHETRHDLVCRLLLEKKKKLKKK